MKIRIYIPTLGRPNQHTWDALPPEIQAMTNLVVSEGELGDHISKGRACLVSPEQGNGIASVRQWICDYHRETFSDEPILLMLDDDFSFKVRIADEPKCKLRHCLPQDTLDLFEYWEVLSEDFIAVGLSPIQGNNRTYPKEYVEATRMYSAYSLNVQRMNELGIVFNSQCDMMEDFHVTLQMLTAGEPNAVIQKWAFNSKVPQNAAGGCATYRTIETLGKTAERLHELYPKYVTVVEKPSNWAGVMSGVRKDVRIQWKKALRGAIG